MFSLRAISLNRGFCIIARYVRFEFSHCASNSSRASRFSPPRQGRHILRGALGVIFKRIACVAGCDDSRILTRPALVPLWKGCSRRLPMAKTKRLADSPRPFVFRARHLDDTPSGGPAVLLLLKRLFLDAMCSRLRPYLRALARTDWAPPAPERIYNVSAGSL